jgi:sterol desaturase/sphingolipid hydroxylase (fatty acid hydroxylase superfamily)
MKFLISRLFFPMAVIGSFSVFLIVRETGGNLEVAIFLPSLAIMLLAVCLERKLPFLAAWNTPQLDLKTDLTSAGVAMFATEPLLKLAGPVIMAALYGLLARDESLGLFPTGLPFVIQVLLAVLIAEFGSYWVHRWHHANPWLWWLHALHHGSRRLYVVNNFRVHPINHVLSALAGILPLMFIGAPADVVMGYLALTSPVVLLQHANLPFRSGLLNYIFSTNEVHRWHHSKVPDEGNRNFGRAIMLWDLVFRTFRYSSQSNVPKSIGLFDGDAYPSDQSYVRQVFSMFRRAPCTPGCCALK